MITVKFMCATCKTHRGMTMNSKGFMQVGHVEFGPCPKCDATEYFLHINEIPDTHHHPVPAGVEIHSESERNELIDCTFLS